MIFNWQTNIAVSNLETVAWDRMRPSIRKHTSIKDLLSESTDTAKMRFRTRYRKRYGRFRLVLPIYLVFTEVLLQTMCKLCWGFWIPTKRFLHYETCPALWGGSSTACATCNINEYIRGDGEIEEPICHLVTLPMPNHPWCQFIYLRTYNNDNIDGPL